MALSLDDRVTMADDVVYRAVGTEAVVLDLAHGVYFGLNDTGTRIWALAVDHDLRGVCQELTREFAAPAATIEQDVLQLIGTLLDKNLIRIVGATREGPA